LKIKKKKKILKKDYKNFGDVPLFKIKKKKN